MKAENKSSKELYEETLAEARKMTKREIEKELVDRRAMHQWAINAYEQALQEKGGN